MIFDKKTIYAIEIVNLIAMESDGMPVPVIAMERIGIGRSHCVSIAKDLTKVGIIKSKEGRSGGYVLGREKKDISIHDIAMAVDNGGHHLFCYGSEKLMRTVSELLEKYTLADFSR